MSTKTRKKLDFGNVKLLDKVYHSRATLPHVIKTDYQFKKCNSGLRKDQIVFQEVYKFFCHKVLFWNVKEYIHSGQQLMFDSLF